MNANRAYQLGVRARDCTITSRSDKDNGDWIIRALGTEISRTACPYTATHYVANLKRTEDKENSK